MIIAITSFSQEIRPPLAPGRPKCNSILHLFGEWLFEAAFVGIDGWSQNSPRKSVIDNLLIKKLFPKLFMTLKYICVKIELAGAPKRPSSVLVDGPCSLQESTNEIPATLDIDRYESGRAEAMGALCRIFCAKKTGEEILPVYLARFYQAIYHGLKVDEVN